MSGKNEIRQAGAKREIQTGEPAPTEIKSLFDLVDVILSEGLDQLERYKEAHNIHYNDPKFIEAQSALVVGQNAIRNARRTYGS